MQKSNSKPRLIWWVLLLQEFDLEIKDMAWLVNLVADHLCYLGAKATPSEELPIDDSFPDELLFAISQQATLWYANLIKFKVYKLLPPGLYYQQRKKFFIDVKYYVWEEHFLHKLCRDGIYKRCLPEDEVSSCTIAMLQPMATILDQIKRLRKYSKLASSSLCSSRMQGNLSWLVIDVNE